MNPLLSPPILFFVLGLLATALRTGLRIPHPIPKLLSLYLLFAIGFKGGVALHEHGLEGRTLGVLAVSVALAALFPVGSFFLLKRRLGAVDAGAIAATYGSVSAVTFITAWSVAEKSGLTPSGWMVAVMAFMESPAIVVGVALIRRFEAESQADAAGGGRGGWMALLHESFLSGPVFLLLGSLAVGWITGPEGARQLSPFARDVFNGVLCFFLLDLGLLAARRVRDLAGAGVVCVAFAVLAPLAQGAVGLGAAWGLGLARADAFLLTLLCGSASYLAVPATMRLVVPRANSGLFVPMALGITFPLNVAVGIPAWLWLLERLGWPLGA